ncbi:MAG: extracellular solute-binding protein [Lachnospiraceae bacterium]|jgi:raffinose/stachyose/melibiose transport system substrate-binding protein|nr:extracellular solute-binding protein [Lachnospiraceae bacterium]
MRKLIKKCTVFMLSVLCASSILAGCGDSGQDGVTQIHVLQYKPEAVAVFERLQEEFNAAHDDIQLVIESPNDAMTILKTKLVREDYPDIIGIGGDMNYSYFVDANILADVSDYEGLKSIKPAYLEMLEGLEFVPTEGTFGVPYVANAAGVLYNRAMFQEHGWQIPTTWSEFIALCEQIQSEQIQPLYFGFRDTWTCLAPWNALAVGLAPADVCAQVNRKETTFQENYGQVADRVLEMLKYGQSGPFAYNYNDACIAFANGETAMYAIGSYAVPQIKSVNPDMDIDSFVMPANDDASKNVLNSGIDLQFCLTKECKDKEAAYEVLDFLLEHDNMQSYLDDQNAVPCKDEAFTLAPMLDGMASYIEEGKMSDYHDHHYPSEMAVDGMIQTFLMEQDKDAFLQKFDKDWLRYNRDIIRKVEEYGSGQ